MLDWNQKFRHHLLLFPPDEVPNLTGAYHLNIRAFHLRWVSTVSVAFESSRRCTNSLPGSMKAR